MTAMHPSIPFLLLLACGPAPHTPQVYPPPILNPIPPQACRIQNRGGELYDTQLSTVCEVARLNGKVACLPKGMWEGVGAAWVTPECDRLYDWSKRNATPCLNGQANYTLFSAGRAGLPQVCGDFAGSIYKIIPTDLRVQYIKERGCELVQNFELDLTVSRYSEFAPYPPVLLTEKDFIDPASEQGCVK